MLGPVELVAEVDSTNRVLAARARAGAAHGTVLVADQQSAGRGRLGRTWEAPAGSSLLVSVLLRPALAPEQAHLVTMAAGLAAAEACEAVAGVRPALKWPNDLLVGDRKLAGLLAESILDGGRVEAVVLGMGLNVQWLGTVPAGGIDLTEAAGRPVDRLTLLWAWLERLERRCADLGERTMVDYRAACGTIGRDVRVEQAGGQTVGRAVAVGDDGRLVVEHPGGTLVVTAADVVHVRATT